MPSQKLNLDQPAEAIDAAEARMRLALGLTGASRPASGGHQGGSSQNHGPQQGPSHDASRPQRRRFAQDGDVPVVMLNRGRDAETGGENRVQALSSELRDERSGRIKAERALEEANLSIQSLKTKLAHAEMAFEERLREEREARNKVEALRTSDQSARQLAEKKEVEAALAVSVLERRLSEVEAEAAAAKSALATATMAAAAVASAKTDLFGEAEPEMPVRKTRAGRRAAAPLLEAPVEFKAEPEVEVEPEIEPEVKRVVAPKSPAKAVQVEKAAEKAAPKAVEKTATKRGTKVSAAAAKAETGEDDQPIEWWLPSFRAARTTGAERKRKTR